ncbi:hypothetical protein C1N91_04600 [Curtobacterium sp. SGAir0471]|uniref:hypothetical protein n=1 Tax=Curtobacterium sp. SGAir0471 TaxID=2070337 RepID=UPI0010CD0840|nr:hypothetical protein [Curtobacterium sp. SGAir0471]QCR42928.1 hypothetical protein C1N91_04600 [Curtobacterium sp. SGAir0471]
MDWWNDLTGWSASDEGWRVLSGAIIPFVAIVVAGVIAALIGRAAAKRVVALHDRESRNSAVAGVVTAARKASRWGALGHEERAYADHLAEDADVRLRLLPMSGAPLAADWVQHELADIKRNSSTFTSQADQSLAELRDRLLEWNGRPGRAKKLFKADLERWKFDSPDPDAELIARQQDWNAGQQQRSADADTTPARPTPTTTSLRPAPQQSGAPAGATAPGSSAPGSPAPWSSGAAAASTTDQDATTPIDDVRGSSDNRTRPYGDRETVPLDGTPVRPQLGSPIASGRPGSSTAPSTRNDLGTRGVDTSDSGEVDPTDRDQGERSDVRPNAAPRVASPTSADAHVNRASASASGLDRSPASGAPASARADDDEDGHEDGHEDGSPYTQPISASELRRRASDDD